MFLSYYCEFIDHNISKFVTDNIHIECPPTLYDVKMPSDIIEDAHEWIETKQGLDDLVEKLKLEKFIAVDTEHHSSRSYLGFIALLQVV